MPILTAPISPHLFVLPEHTNFMPLLPSDIYDIHKLQVIRKKNMEIHGTFDLILYTVLFKMRIRDRQCIILFRQSKYQNQVEEWYTPTYPERHNYNIRCRSSS